MARWSARRGGLAELDDEQTTRAKVGETVAQWVTDPAEREWIEPALLTLLGVEGGMASDQLFSAWRTFFERIAANGPGRARLRGHALRRPGLLDFIDHLLEWSRGVPIYVVTLARPELIERRPSWGAGKRNFFSMYLEPLPEADMRELLAGLVPGLPQSAVTTIVGRADGIPLYAVETVRTLVADGRLVEQDGVYVPQGDLTHLAVPETLTALIAARLDRLDETDRRIVHDAAVLGQSFTQDALAALADVPVTDLDARLTGLVRRELLRHELDPRSPERGQYAFVQALIREVAYNTLSKKDRKKLHLAAARYFEATGSDEIAGALASHYLAAHANAGEDGEADALAGQARIALKAAASRAEALGSYEQALSLYEQALTVTSDPAERADLLDQAATAARIGSHWQHAEELCRQAIELHRKVGRRLAAARSTGELGYIVGNQMRTDELIELLEAALSEFADLDDAAALDRIRMGIARSVSFQNEHRRALEMVDPVLESAELRDDVELLTRAMLTKASALVALGRRREGIGLNRALIEIATENGLTDMILRSKGNLGGYLSDLDLSASVATYREGLELARRVGHRDMVLQAAGNIGYSGFLAGEWDMAMAELEDVWSDELEPRDALLVLNNLLIIRANRGESIDEGLAHMERMGEGLGGVWQLFMLDPSANSALARGDFSTAREMFERVAREDASQGPEYYYRAFQPALWSRDLATARRLAGSSEAAGGFGPLVAARRATMRAGIAALEGSPAEALLLFRDALRGWRQTHAVWDEALTGIDMATLLDPAEPEVAATIKSTREILERLGAKPYLERLNAAVAGKSAAAPKSSSVAPASSGVAVAD